MNVKTVEISEYELVSDVKLFIIIDIMNYWKNKWKAMKFPGQTIPPSSSPSSSS